MTMMRWGEGVGPAGDDSPGQPACAMGVGDADGEDEEEEEIW